MNLTPEQELLLLCVSPVRNDARSSRIASLLAGPLDRRLLEDLAHAHRLAPLLHWELKSLDTAFRDNLKNSLLLTRELVTVIDALAREGIPALPFKGPTLAIAAYNNIALRSFGDLDILVRREDVWRVRDLLQTAGYQPKVQLSRDREPAYLNAYDELVMYGLAGSPLLEIHWAFVPPHFSFDLKFSDCWTRHQQLTLANRTLPSLHPEDLFLVLCVHGSKHCWSYLALICDVAWLLKNHPPDWPSLLERARKLGVHRMVSLAVALAAKVFELPLPSVEDPAVAPLADEILATLFGAGHDETSIRANGSLHLRMRERLRDRITYVARLASRPGIEDWEMIDLPRPLAFLYPLLRYPRLALKYRSRIP
jgi:hypothetical protein